MSTNQDPNHQIERGAMEWRCSCGAWSAPVPPVRGYADTTPQARHAQLQFGFDKHVKSANKAQQKPKSARTSSPPIGS